MSSRSNFERFVSARPGRLDHPEMFAEARDRPASQERSEQQSKCESVFGANQSPSLNDPFQGHTEPFDGSSQGNSQRSNEASSHGDIEPPNEASSHRDIEPPNEAFSQGDTEPLNDALLQGDAEPSSAADTNPLSDLSLLVEREPFNGPLERQPSLHDAPDPNGRTLQGDREAADKPCLQAEPEPLKPSFQHEPKLLNESSLPVESERLSKPFLEDASDIVVAPLAPLNDPTQTPVSRSDELAVSEPHKGDRERSCRTVDVSANSALRAVDNFMVELVQYLHARRSAVEPADPSPNQHETRPRLSLRLRNDFQQQDLRYDPHTDWVGLIDEGATYRGPLEKPPNSTNDSQIVSQDTLLPAMVAVSAGVHNHENPLIEPPRDDNVRAARDLGDLPPTNQIAKPALPAEDTARPPSSPGNYALTNEDISRSGGHEFGPLSAPNDWVCIDLQEAKTAPDLAEHSPEIDLQAALDAFEKALKLAWPR